MENWMPGSVRMEARMRSAHAAVRKHSRNALLERHQDNDLIFDAVRRRMAPSDVLWHLMT
eukprot:CAMPEP_0179300508 /NCGR_PEP_ID=MMETSP0797-20121207/47069_1 /TAXON_ID=47934 /ORGANISM="Dinophysis acuminata, Strain DAEP01" /LENGTH=59 /DNA_ID=CAMNT_0021009977 /DNA_START=170 /DNA_END=346 /DNA_ORIENTATION=+